MCTGPDIGGFAVISVTEAGECLRKLLSAPLGAGSAVEGADDYCGRTGETAQLVNMVDGRTRPLSPFQSSIVFRCISK